MLDTSQFHYSTLLNFIDSLTNLFLILFAPVLFLLVSYIFYTIFEVSKKENKYINAIFFLIVVAFLGAYIYYAFYILDYMELLKNALYSIIVVFMYVVVSPIILLTTILSTSDIEGAIFMHNDLLLGDIKKWAFIKFGLQLDTITKELLLIFFKLLTLLIFSSKIINVTRFIISSITHSHSKLNTIFAYLFYGVFFTLYITLNYDELTKIFTLLLSMGQHMLQGDLI